MKLTRGMKRRLYASMIVIGSIIGAVSIFNPSGDKRMTAGMQNLQDKQRIAMQDFINKEASQIQKKLKAAYKALVTGNYRSADKDLTDIEIIIEDYRDYVPNSVDEQIIKAVEFLRSAVKRVAAIDSTQKIAENGIAKYINNIPNLKIENTTFPDEALGDYVEAIYGYLALLDHADSGIPLEEINNLAGFLIEICGKSKNDLANQIQELNKIMNNTSNPIIISNCKNTINLLNKAFEKLTIAQRQAELKII